MTQQLTQEDLGVRLLELSVHTWSIVMGVSIALDILKTGDESLRANPAKKEHFEKVRSTIEEKIKGLDDFTERLIRELAPKDEGE